MALKALALLAAALVVSGCASMSIPHNREQADIGRAYQARYQNAPLVRESDRARRALMNECAPRLSAKAWPKRAAEPELLSSGDLVAVEVRNDKVFSGDFEISQGGFLQLPYLEPVPAIGREPHILQRDVARRLVAQGFYRTAPIVSVRLKDVAPASVHVSGAVFSLGGVSIGGVSGADRDLARQAASGATAGARTLSSALRAAGGVRPDADLTRVQLIRDGERRELDLSGAIEGRRFEDPVLLAEDEVLVPSLGCFQEALVRPSAVSPPGVTINMSNLTQPSPTNATSAIGRDTREMPYGSRFLQAVFKMNCMGGAKTTNANRYAVLFSRNPASGRSVVIERNLEALLRRSDRDDFDPYLLPGDSIACYDSTIISITELAKALGVAVGAAALFAL